MRSVLLVGSVILTGLVLSGRVHAQTNSWTYPSGGYWDDFRNWSLGVPPASPQAVLITNAPAKLVTIDAYTSGNFPGSMTITSLTLSADTGLTNTLFLSDAGTATPLSIQDSLMVLSGGALFMTNSSLQVGGPAGGSFLLEGTAMVSGTNSFAGGVYMGYSTNSTGTLYVNGGLSIITNGYTTVGFYGSGALELPGGILQVGDSNSAPNGIFVGSTPGAQGTAHISGGTWLASDHLSIGDQSNTTGAVWLTGGQIMLTDNYLTTIGGDGIGQLTISNGQFAACSMIVGTSSNAAGTLTVASGTATLSGGLIVGDGLNSTGFVSITSGQLTATNQALLVGNYGFGQLTVSNGSLQARAIRAGFASNSLAVLNLADGEILATSNIVAGVLSNATGIIQVSGGKLTVTNQSSAASLMIGQQGKGTFIQSGGTSTVDQLTATNGTNSVFTFNAGVFNTKSTTFSNSQVLAVWNGATFHLLGGVHTFANGLFVGSGGTLSGCGTIVGNVTVNSGGTVLIDCGTLTLMNGFYSVGNWQAVNGSVLEAYGPVTNIGLIDVIDGQTNFHGGLVNTGVILTRDNIPKILAVSLVGSNAQITFTTFSNQFHIVEYTDDLAHPNWQPLTSFFNGPPGITNILDSGAATVTQRFYRIHLEVSVPL